MTEEAKQTDTRGLPPGVTPENLSEGETRTGPIAPTVDATGPVKQPEPEKTAEENDKEALEETHGEPDQKPEDAQSEPGKEADKEPTVETEYPTYEDPAANAVVGLLKDAGVTPADATTIFGKAVETGDLTQVDLKGLTEKVGKDKATLIMYGVKEYYNTKMAVVKETVDGVYKVFGGEENFIKAREWAKDKASNDKAFQAQVAELNKLFDTSTVAAKLAAKELKAMYEGDPKNSSLSVKMQAGDAASSTSANATMSRADYLEQLKVAEAKGDVNEIAKLHAIRKRSIAAGIR